MKIIVKFIKNYSPYIKGDFTKLEIEEYNKLNDLGVVVRNNILCKEYENPTYYRKELTGKNLLGKEYIKNKVDVVVLTNGKVKTIFNSSDYGINTSEIIKSDFVKTGIGFAENCNKGAESYKKLGEFILFLNDDVIIKDKKQFIIDLLDPFKDNKIGIVGTECSSVCFGVNGSILCIRRELFEMIGGFDDNYFFMWEDNDINKQIKIRGFDIAISKAEAIHKGKMSMNSESDFWKKNFFEGKDKFEKKFRENKIIGSMIVGDEDNRYLPGVVKRMFLGNLVDKLVIILDKSNKATCDEINSLKQIYNIKTYYHDFKLFGKAENLLRERAIQYAMSEYPYAIIPIDADEILDEDFNRDEAMKLLEKGICWDFMIAHFYKDKEHIRIDGVFAHQKNARLFKVLWDKDSKFYNKNLHCGSCPIYAYEKRKTCDFIFKHYGYIKENDRIDKVNRQKKFDKNKLLESNDLYNRIIDNVEAVEFNKSKFIKIWKQ
jgi:hypothetical protein